jgi:hypothetical protein
VQVSPGISSGVHVPPGPGIAQKSLVDAQSAPTSHSVLHEVPSAQTKPPAHGAAVPGTHVPPPSQAPAGVSIAFAHMGAPHVVPLVGYTQAPVPSQSVAPHVPPVVQPAEQQSPFPLAPHTFDAHW